MCKKYEADIHQFRTDTLLSDGLKPTITHLTNSEAAFLRSHLDGNFVLIAGNNFFSVFPQNNSLLPTSLDMVLNETHFPLFFFFYPLQPEVKMLCHDHSILPPKLPHWCSLVSFRPSCFSL